jgi:O-antigen/teichoic acid export membrane protein
VGEQAPASRSGGPAPRNLKDNLAACVLGNIGYGAAQLGMVSVLARATSVDQVGRYVLALAVCAPVFGLTALKLRQMQSTDVRDQFTFGHYLALRLLAVTLAAAGLTGAAAVLGSRAGLAVLLAVILTKAAEGVLDTCYGAMTQREQLHQVARSQLVRGCGGLAAFAAAVLATGRVEYAAFALAGFTGARCAVDLRRVRRLGFSTRPRFQWRVLGRLARVAVPLGLALCASSLLVNAPRYVLGDAAQVGVYAALAYLLTGGGALVTALATTAAPRLARYHAAGQERPFRALLTRMAALGAGLGGGGALVALLLGRPLLGLVYGPGYAAHADVLVLLLLAAVLNWSSLAVGTALDAVRVFRVQLPVQLLALAVVVGAALLLVPALGLVGAALAELLAAGVKALHYLVLQVRVVNPALRRAGRGVPAGAALATAAPGG